MSIFFTTDNTDDSRGPTSLSVTISDNKGHAGKLKTFRVLLRPPMSSGVNHSIQIGILSVCPSAIRPRQTIRACTRLFALYLGRLDPAGILGLDANKVRGVIIGGEMLSTDQDYLSAEARRSFDQSSDLVLDIGDGGETFCSVSALHPLSDVKSHLETLKKEGLLVMAGPKGTGKKHYATSLFEALFQSGSISRIDCRKRTHQEIEAKLKQHSQGGVILDNSPHEVIKQLYQTSDRQVSVIAIMKEHNNNNDFVIDADMSVCQACGVTLPLSLRRRAIAAELASGLSNDDMLQALSWLGQLLGHLSSRHSDLVSSEVGLDRLQRDCPAEGTTRQFRQWFARWWNGELASAFKDCGGDEDPREYVLRTWPWRDGAREALKPLLPPGNRLPSGEERTKPEGAEDPLVSHSLSASYGVM